MPITGFHVSLFLYALIVLALLIAELREDRRAQFFFKPLAAFGFVILALQSGALESTYGNYILAGLVFCTVGDILLLPRESESIFKAGMFAFAIGHLNYVFAANIIIKPDMNYVYWLGTTILGLAFGLYVFIRLRDSLPEKLLWPVGIYTFIISLMVIRSLQTDAVSWHIAIIPAAIMFAVSDMFVAKDRFVKPDPRNAFAITPLYFGAQALFALSVSI